MLARPDFANNDPAATTSRVSVDKIAADFESRPLSNLCRRGPYGLNTGQHHRSRSMDDKTRIELEAAAFRGLVEHLQKRTDVQNIDLMNLAGFCRNCLSKWYQAAAKER